MLFRSAWEAGIGYCLIPEKNVREASRIRDMKIAGVSSLTQAITCLNASPGERGKWLAFEKICGEAEPEREPEPDFCEITGQEGVKRGALLAAAGFHNLLIVGPPGSGKTMTARRLPSILPPLSNEESLEVSAIYSIAGLLDGQKPYIARRPFLNPHHSVSPQALTGGGRIPKPGVVSLAHRGVLFMDEMPEFKKQTLDMLRQPKIGRAHV